MWPEADKTHELLDLVRDGDAAAVERLLARHREALRRMIEMRLDGQIRQRVDASDVVQDTLMEANRRLDKYLDNPGMPFHLWLRQIATDRIIDAHRRHRKSRKRSVDLEQAPVVPANLDHSAIHLDALHPDKELTPAAAAMHRELQRRFEEAIEQMDARDQEIIVMRHFEKLSNQEAAQALGLTEPAASMRHLRATRRLAEILSDDDSEA